MSGTSLAMMPWFPRDFIAATLGWRLLERGLYRCLLDAQWELGSLPSDPEELALIAGATATEFATAWPRVSAKFVSAEGGRLSNEKLEEHREKALRIKRDRVEAGRTGGKASASKRQANVEAKHQATEVAIVKHPTPTPSPISEGVVDAREKTLLPEGEMAIALRDLGVSVTSMDQTLAGWIRDGITVQQAVDAVGLARIRKPYPERIPANYLDPILRQPQRPPVPRQQPKGAWQRMMEANGGE